MALLVNELHNNLSLVSKPSCKGSKLKNPFSLSKTNTLALNS